VLALATMHCFGRFSQGIFYKCNHTTERSAVKHAISTHLDIAEDPLYAFVQTSVCVLFVLEWIGIWSRKV